MGEWSMQIQNLMRAETFQEKQGHTHLRVLNVCVIDMKMGDCMPKSVADSVLSLYANNICKFMFSWCLFY